MFTTLKKFTALLLALIFVALSGAPAEKKFYRDDELRMIARTFFSTINETHYRTDIQMQTMSDQFYLEYFDRLDPGKLFFTKQDVLDFDRYRFNLLLSLRLGGTEFGFKLYALYRERMLEYCRFAEEALKTPFDFSVDESYFFDRAKAERPADEAEMHELWRKKLKNDVLYYRLLDRAMQKNDADDKEQQAIRKLWDSGTPEERLLRRLRDQENVVVSREKVDILGIYLDTLAQVYGPHSNYTSPNLKEDHDIIMKVSLTGIGATLSSDGGLIKIVALVPGGPADRDGRLKVEDRIIAVIQENGESTDVVDMPVDKAVHFIRGEVGTKVTLVVLSGKNGKNSVPESITLVREKVDLVDSIASGKIREVKTPDGRTLRIGVLTLPGFYIDFDAAQRNEPDYRSCYRDVKNILENFNRENVDAVVMDIRKNGGGSLAEVVKMAGLFFRTGPVVQVRNRDREISVLRDTDPSITYRGPLVVLISKLSASASEIFASALKDCQRALIVGDSRTFGKGTVLDVIDLEPYPPFLGLNFPAGTLTCENSMFFRPSGSSVQQLGLASDIKLPSLTEEMEVGELFMHFHLPWDSIDPAVRSGYYPQLESLIPILAERSAQRIAADSDYAELLKEIELIRQHRQKKEISLNEEVRIKEYEQEKAVLKSSEEALSEESTSGGKKSKDPVLTETLNIAADLVELLEKN